MGAQPANILKKRETKGWRGAGVSNGFQLIQSPSGDQVHKSLRRRRFLEKHHYFKGWRESCIPNGSRSKIWSVQTFICDRLHGPMRVYIWWADQRALGDAILGNQGIEGEASKQHGLQELKYLATRAYFHHYEGLEIRHQTSFSPIDEFITLGSLIARPPLLRGWKTYFHFIRSNFFLLVFPPSQRKLRIPLEIFSRFPFVENRP